MIQFNSKVILVTGASSGIGKAAAIELGRLGATVIVSDLNEKAGIETVEVIRSAGGKASFIGCDVSQESQVSDMIRTIAKTHYRLDGAFNNAGIATATPIGDTPTSQWEKILRVDLTSIWLCAKYEIKQMLEQKGGGSIVNTASVAGVIGLPSLEAYSAAKAGVIGITRTLALDHAKVGIRVNALCPGFTKTPMMANEEAQRASLAATPMGRGADPGEIADAALWMLSDRSSFLTGQTIVVDGGLTCH